MSGGETTTWTDGERSEEGWRRSDTGTDGRQTAVSTHSTLIS